MPNDEEHSNTPPRRQFSDDPIGAFFDGLNDLSNLGNAALDLVAKQGERTAQQLNRSPEQLRLLAAAGDALRDMREVAGLNLRDVAEALNIGDLQLLQDAEDGKASLPFEVILRLSSLLARNDPIPFVMKLTRSYNPRLWTLLSEWGLDRIPLQYEREREFVNIYRQHDRVRDLSDEDFERLLGFTSEAFTMALHFIRPDLGPDDKHAEQDNEASE